MKPIKKIARKNLPAPLPLFPTLTLYLVLDKWDAAGWVWGAVGVVMVFIWIACIIELCVADEVNVLKTD